ncbi:MAG TPA: 3-deoxy-manno-octulosonate cytidylyltransferase [Prolixibacteraceae bacterium]|nr:3-deoxy-manno-octulosonate cytidylyltransferase [Prolixibacteraceae bacterium]HPS12214.1 3-deoxy-manno-octulosonate cytidylyltransferase [Prolixibacteraceae bacterium]
MKNALIIIPARYASTRFPGKPLALIHGKPMIQHVVERCKMVCDQVVVATDDDRIAETVKTFGGRCIITSSEHQSGTDRCAEAAAKLTFSDHFDVIINVQGDEPFIDPGQIEQIIGCFDDPNTEIATLITPITSSEVLFNPNKVKVVKSASDYALYFSRQPIPFHRDLPENEWIGHARYFLHIGMYAFKPEVLQAVTRLEPSMLEKSEKLEQLRWLENGYRIKTAVTQHTNIGIDTPADLEEISKFKK